MREEEMNNKIIFYSVSIANKTVNFTGAFFMRSRVNEENETDILTSNFYNDAVNGVPYLKEEQKFMEDFIENYPEQYKRVLSGLKKLGVIRKGEPKLLTESAVRAIFHVYDIDPETLLKGGPKVPVRQNNLFGSSTPQQTELPAAQKKANILFPPAEGKRKKRRGGNITRLHKPGVNIKDETVDKLINLSKPLMPLIFNMPAIQEKYKAGYSFVFADMTVGEVDEQKLFGIKFHDDGEYEFTIKRINTEEIGIQNICIDKKSAKTTYSKALALFKKHKLLHTALFQPEIAEDTIMFEIGEEL
jgi:hypothetical protein